MAKDPAVSRFGMIDPDLKVLEAKLFEEHHSEQSRNEDGGFVAFESLREQRKER